MHVGRHVIPSWGATLHPPAGPGSFPCVSGYPHTISYRPEEYRRNRKRYRRTLRAIQPTYAKSSGVIENAFLRSIWNTTLPSIGDT